MKQTQTEWTRDNARRAQASISRPRLNAKMVLGILREQNISEPEARRRIKSDPLLSLELDE